MSVFFQRVRPCTLRLVTAAVSWGLLAACSPTRPKNLEDLYGTWNLISRTILDTPEGIIIEEPGTPGFRETTLIINKDGTYTSIAVISGEETVEEGKWEAEGSNIIILKTGGVTRYGTFAVKQDILNIELTLGFDFTGDGYPESYTVIMEYERAAAARE